MKKEIIEDYMLRYGVVCGKRKSEHQKIKFLRAVKKQFERNGYAVNTTKASMTFMKAEKKSFYNFYAGDLKKAKVIFITYYDTAIKSFLPQKQFAFTSGYQKSTIYINMLISLTIIIMVATLLYTCIFPNIQKEGIVSIWGVLTLVLSLVALFIITRIRDGIANRFNLVRNSSSVITLCALAEECGVNKNDIAFAFIDGGTQSEYGLSMLKEYVGSAHPLKIYLDSVGNGDDIHCFTNEEVALDINVHPLSKNLSKYGDILLTSGEIQNHQVWIKHANTSKDKNLEVSRIQKMLEILKIIIPK